MAVEMLFAVVVLAVAVAAARLVIRGRDPEGTAEGPGGHVLVGVSRPVIATPLGRLAASFARPIRGRVSPVAVVALDATVDERARADETVRRCAAVAAEEGLEADGIVRVDGSVADGLYHGAIEYDASSVVLGWPRGGSTAEVATAIEQLVSRLPVPTLVARLDGYRWHRIVLRVPSGAASEGLRASLRLATRAAERVADATGVPVACTSDSSTITASPSELVIVPVAPDAGAIRRAVAMADVNGDVVLAVCHGDRVLDHRSLLPSAAELYESRPPATPVPAGDLVRLQER